MNEFTPCEATPDYHALITIQLVELVNDGIFSFEKIPLEGCFDELNAVDNSIAPRLKEMFIERNLWREISIIPYLQWAQQLAYRIKYELVPKFAPMYKAIAEGTFNPLHVGDEYYKERIVDSKFPETLLSGSNESYLSYGHDKEFERVDAGNALEVANKFYNDYYSVDEAFMLELDVFFCDLWSVNVNGL